MARQYHNLKQWNHWLATSSGGQYLLSEEGRVFTKLTGNVFSKHTVLIGVPEQKSLLPDTSSLHRFVISALPNQGIGCIEADYQALPIMTGQVDLVLLPHTLEWVEHPRQLLAEACRIVKPEGLIAIFGFNPNSLFKLTQLLDKKRNMPWRANFLAMSELKKWMELAGFEIERSHTFLYRPLTKYAYFFDRFPLCEWIGEQVFPYYGGLYIILARAKEIPLTPIKMQWKQKLSGVRISPAISGQPIRNGIR